MVKWVWKYAMLALAVASFAQALLMPQNASAESISREYCLSLGDYSSENSKGQYIQETQKANFEPIINKCNSEDFKLSCKLISLNQLENLVKPNRNNGTYGVLCREENPNMTPEEKLKQECLDSDTCMWVDGKAIDGQHYCTKVKNLEYDPKKRDCIGEPVEPAEQGDAATCNIDGLGWLFCPLMDLIAGINDTAYSFISGAFLAFDAKLLNTNSPAYKTWGSFRDIANILFVIAFIIIVLSQLTSIGISNYGIKKMLPRLIVVAILVNTSYIISQVLVDLSNIVGYGINQLISGVDVGSYDKDAGAIKDAAGKALSWGTAITAVVAAGVGIALAMTWSTLFFAFLALLLVLMILVGRKALIVLLVVISPLAFVAFLLPNTEKLFKKWWGLFSTMLLLFPIIGAVFGASNLTARIIANSASTTGGVDQLLMYLTALGVMGIPLFAVPGLTIGSLKAAGAIGEKIAGATRSASGRLRKSADNSRLGDVKRKVGMKFGEWGAKSRSNSKFDRSYIGKKLGTNRGAARATAAHTNAQEDMIKDEMTLMSHGWDAHQELPNAQNELASALQSGDEIRSAAATRFLTEKGEKGLDAIQDAIETYESNGGEHTKSVEQAKQQVEKANVKSTRAGLYRWGHSNSNDDAGKLGALRKQSETYSSLTDAQLIGQSAEDLEWAFSEGGLSHDRARDIMADKDLRSGMKQAQRDVFSRYANAPQPAQTSPAPPSNPPNTPPPSPPAPPSNPPNTPPNTSSQSGIPFN